MPTITDNIYGKFEFTEPLLIDLYNCAAVQRLGKIHQAGATYLVKKGRDGNRLEHSLGVMYLIRILGGSIEEQAAGLLHDISHTSFSHVIDQVFDNRDETFHEAHKEWLTQTSGIGKIVEKHGYVLESLLEEEDWKILEQSLPDLCADRIDYTLRDLHGFGLISTDEINHFVQCLSFQQGKIVISDRKIAKWFTEQYFREVTELFMNPTEIYANNFLASILKKAHERNIISVEDMLTENDDKILEKIVDSHQSDLVASLQILNPQLTVVANQKDYEFQGFSKPRFIDPLVLTNGSLQRLSELDPDVISMREEVKSRAVAGVFVKRILSTN